MLLGVRGVCVISHGSSSARAIVNAVRVASRSRRRRPRVGPASPAPWPEVVGAARQWPPRRDTFALGLSPFQEERVPAETHVERTPARPSGRCSSSMKSSLADILEIDPSTITEGASFGDDLGADSLALIELVEALEEELGERSVGFRIDDEDLEDLKTVRDAVDYVIRQAPSRTAPLRRVARRTWYRADYRDDASPGGPPGAGGSRIPDCWPRPWPTGRGVPRTGAGRIQRAPGVPWATPCSASSLPTTCSGPIPTLPEGELAKVAGRSRQLCRAGRGGGRAGPRGRPPAGQGRGRQRWPGQSRRSWPTPSRP